MIDKNILTKAFAGAAVAAILAGGLAGCAQNQSAPAGKVSSPAAQLLTQADFDKAEADRAEAAKKYMDLLNDYHENLSPACVAYPFPDWSVTACHRLDVSWSRYETEVDPSDVSDWTQKEIAKWIKYTKGRQEMIEDDYKRLKDLMDTARQEMNLDSRG